jgi:hypothetical protein
VEFIISVREPEEGIPFRRHRRTWKDNIKIDVKKIGREVYTGVRWLYIRSSADILRTC